MNFADMFLQQLNNPECSMLTGAFIGQLYIVRWLFFLFIAMMIYQAVNKLAWLPLIEWIKKKIYKKKR
jgi:hypothetical protein